MTQSPRQSPSLFTQVEIGAGRESDPELIVEENQSQLLRQILAAQDRQNELLEELVAQVGASQRQRTMEMQQWKQANPALSRACQKASEALSKVQTEFLIALTEEVNENAEGMMDGEFLLNEFIDRFGPRLAHLNGVLQVLSQLSTAPNATSPPNSP